MKWAAQENLWVWVPMGNNPDPSKHRSLSPFSPRLSATLLW